MAIKTEPNLSDLLDAAGFCIQGPGDDSNAELAGRYWWTLLRDGWSGVECGPDFATASEATDDAVAALLADEDLDWAHCRVFSRAIDQFPADFAARMQSVQSSGRGAS